MKKILRLNSRGFGHHIILPVIVIALIALVGVRVMLASHAAAPTIAAPTNLQLNDASTTQAALTWSPSTTANVTYQVLRNGVVVAATDTYTRNYLDTGLSPGTTYTYTVDAVKKNKVSLPSTSLAVTTGSTTSTISSCGKTISAPGNYVLTANISATNNIGNENAYKCINVANTNNVSINCQGNQINIDGTYVSTFFNFTNVSHVLLTNCTDIESASANPLEFSDFWFSGLNDATFEDNNFGNSYTTYGNVAYETVVNFTPTNTNDVYNNNKFSDAGFTLVAAINNYVGNNTFTANSPGEISPTGSTDGTDNIFDDNSITGNPTYTDNEDVVANVDSPFNVGSFQYTENGDIIVNNKTNYARNCGVEGIGALENVTILNNTFKNYDVSAICDYDASWKGNTVEGNIAIPANSNWASPDLFYFYDGNPVPTGDTVYFENNKFIDNTFEPTASTITGTDGIDIYMTGEQSPYVNSSNSVLSNNLFKGNNLTHDSVMRPPYILPTSMVANKGSNICVNLIGGASAKSQNGLNCK